MGVELIVTRGRRPGSGELPPVSDFFCVSLQCSNCCSTAAENLYNIMLKLSYRNRLQVRHRHTPQSPRDEKGFSEYLQYALLRSVAFLPPVEPTQAAAASLDDTSM